MRFRVDDNAWTRSPGRLDYRGELNRFAVLICGVGVRTEVEALGAAPEEYWNWSIRSRPIQIAGEPNDTSSPTHDRRYAAA
jgi:hypothetical protein